MQNEMEYTFDYMANHPHFWKEKALDLLMASRILRQAEESSEIEIDGEKVKVPFLRSYWPKIMIRAFALECLIKALWLKNGNILYQGEKYVGIDGMKLHHLSKMFAMTRFKAGRREGKGPFYAGFQIGRELAFLRPDERFGGLSRDRLKDIVDSAAIWCLENSDSLRLEEFLKTTDRIMNWSASVLPSNLRIIPLSSLKLFDKASPISPFGTSFSFIGLSLPQLNGAQSGRVEARSHRDNRNHRRKGWRTGRGKLEHQKREKRRKARRQVQ